MEADLMAYLFAAWVTGYVGGLKVLAFKKSFEVTTS